MDVEYFLPSEVARLVLGYLKEQGCEKAYKAFLSESPHLQEYASLLKRGRQYPTSIYGKSLQDMVHMYGLLHSKDLIERLKQQIANASHDDSGSRNTGCDDLSDAASSSVGRSKFNLSSDSDDNRSTPTDTEDSGVASTTHSTVPRTSPNDWRIGSFTNTKASRIPRPKPKTKMVKRSGKSVAQRSPKRSPLRCSLSPVKPVKASTSNSMTPLNSHRTEPNRTKDHKKSHKRDYKSIVPQEISSILPCNDESVEIASPMLSSTRQSFVQSSRYARTSDEKPKQQSQSTVNQCTSLRALLTKPPVYSVTSTPIVNTSATAKHDFLTITINSPSRAPSNRSAARTPARKREPTATVTRETSGVIASQTIDTRSAQNEEPVDTSSHISDVDAAEMRSFGFKTPLKRNVDSPASSIGIGKSPRRKCSAPRRRSQGTDVLLAPSTTVKPVTPVSLSSTSALTVPSATVVPSTSSCSATATVANSVQNQEIQDVPAIPMVEELASNRDLVEKLAETINKHVRFDLGRSTPSVEKVSDNKPDLIDGTTQHSNNSDSLDAILDLGSNIDEALQEIVDHTKNEPAFDSLFKMFNVDKYKFIEEEYGEPAPTTCSGLVTPPCPVVTGIASNTTTTYASEPCSFGAAPPSNQSIVQPEATYTHVASTPCAPLPEPQQEIQPTLQTTVQQTPQTALQLTHPALQSALQQIQPSTSAVLAQPGLPFTFIPVAELKTVNKTNDPSKIKSSGDKVSNKPVGSLTVVSDLPIANDLPELGSMPVLHIDDCDPSSEDVLMGRVHTASIIHPSKSGNSPDKVETVRIIGYELPKDCQQLVNESPSWKKDSVVEKDPVLEQLKEARKPGAISRGKSPTQHAPPRKQRRFRNYSSSSHENVDVLSSQSDAGESWESARLFPATISDNEEENREKEAGDVSDGIDRTSVCSTSNKTAAKLVTAEQQETNPDSPAHRPCTRSGTRSKTSTESRDPSLESNRSTSSKSEGKTKPAGKRNSKRKREEDAEDKDQELSREEVTKTNKGRQRSTSRGKGSSKKKTKKDKAEDGAKSQEKSSKSKKNSKRSKEMIDDKNVSKDSEAELSAHKADAVEEDLGMPEVDLSTLFKPKSSDAKDGASVNAAVGEKTTSNVTDNLTQKVIGPADVETNQDKHGLNDSHASVEDLFQTPNEYNKSIGFNVSDPDQHGGQSVSETDKSKVSAKKDDSNTDSAPAKSQKSGSGAKNTSKKAEVTVEKKGTKKKITRKKIKREIGPLTIAAKKAELAKASDSAMLECNNSNMESETMTPALNFKKVPTYIAPTPSPASSFSSASMTPKHVRMLDFGLAQTPPCLPGQSPPISSIGAQVTLGFRSPVYAQLGTPGSVHSQGGNTPNGSECGGFMSPAYHPSPASCGAHTPNPSVETVPSFLADHVFGQFSEVQVDTNQTPDMSDAQRYETPSKPLCAPEESSEASRFAAKLGNVESPNMIRAIANTLGIPTEDGGSNVPSTADVSSVIQSPPELPNFGRSQMRAQPQNAENSSVVSTGESTSHTEAAEALITMANTPAKGQPDQTTICTNGTDQLEGITQESVPDGAQNEDSSSSSVASRDLMPPPAMTPKRNLYKTPKKQMIRTAESVSPAKSPSLKSLIEASFISELSQSPRTSRKNLDMMDDFINSSLSGSPAFKMGTPQKFVFGTPVKESPMKVPLVDTPSKSLEAFVSQFTTPQKNKEVNPEKTVADSVQQNETAEENKTVQQNETTQQNETAQQNETTQQNETVQQNEITQQNETVQQNITAQQNETSTTGVEMPPQVQTDTTSADTHSETSGNISDDSAKKKKKKSKDKDKEKKEKKKSKSKKKYKDKDKEVAGSAEKEKHSGKKHKHKRSKSTKEKREELVKLETQKYLNQTPLGSRSPLVCGMSLSQFDTESNSSKPSEDIALLMDQTQSSPGKGGPLTGQGACAQIQSSPVKCSPLTGQGAITCVQIQSSPVRCSQLTGQGTTTSVQVHKSSDNRGNNSAPVPNIPDNGETATLCAVNSAVSESESASTTNKTECEILSPKGAVEESTSAGNGQTEVTSERRPLAEKSTTAEKGEVKRGKKRHRHREDKEDTTPEKKKQKKDASRVAEQDITHFDPSQIHLFLDATHSAQIT